MYWYTCNISKYNQMIVVIIVVNMVIMYMKVQTIIQIVMVVVIVNWIMILTTLITKRIFIQNVYT